MQQYNKIVTAGYKKSGHPKRHPLSVDIPTGHKKRGHLDPFLIELHPIQRVLLLLLRVQPRHARHAPSDRQRS